MGVTRLTGGAGFSLVIVCDVGRTVLGRVQCESDAWAFHVDGATNQPRLQSSVASHILAVRALAAVRTRRSADFLDKHHIRRRCLLLHSRPSKIRLRFSRAQQIEAIMFKLITTM